MLQASGSYKHLDVSRRGKKESALSVLSSGNIYHVGAILEQSLKYLNFLAKTGVVSFKDTTLEEEKFASVLQEASMFTFESFISFLEQFDRETPAIPLFILSAAPIEKIGLSREQKKALGAMSFQWLKMLSQQEKPSFLSFIWFWNYRKTKVSTLRVRGETFYRGAVRLGGKKYSFSISHFVILRALARRGLLDFSAYNPPAEVEYVKQKLIKLIETALTGQALRISPAKDACQSIDISMPGFPIFAHAYMRDYRDKAEIVGVGITPAYDGILDSELEKLPMLSIGWRVMRINDYRINWHYKNQAEAMEIAKRLRLILAECLLDGCPISIKSTTPDEKKYQGRYLIYVDTILAEKIFKHMPAEFKFSPSVFEKSLDIRLYPYGIDAPLYIRTNREGGAINPATVKSDFASIIASLTSEML